MIDPNHPATLAQTRAARPTRSTWVSANAGSGKTRVLTDRVARLLFSGTDPMQILCLTYTKAAAAEMQNRLFRRLGEWAMMPDEPLAEELVRLGETQAASEETLRNARTLFAAALETPGGLKIQTIHAFCDRLLRRFPLEAGVSPGFEMLEERQQAQLTAQILDEMSDGPEFAAYAPWLEAEPDRHVEAILRYRDAFATIPDEAALLREFGLNAILGPEEVLARLMGSVADNDLADLVVTFETAGGTIEKRNAPLLRQILAGGLSAERALEALLGIILTAKGEPRKSGFPTKGVADTMPGATDICDTLTEAALEARETLLAGATARRTLALRRFGHAFLGRYNAAKAARALLDFDDLILRAQALLHDSPSAAWVQYKMDNGIDHVLVDEAQDTSPAQWQVIKALTEDFFAGLSARDTPRTVFVVGDEKQSIYSFQGADPAAFGEMRAHYRNVIAAATEPMEVCQLLHSFRSAPPVLQVVDEVFRQSPVHGLGQQISHAAFNSGMPGRVELWPFIEPPEKSEEPPWDDPVDMPPKDDPAIQLAARIADWAQDLLAAGHRLPGGDRPIQPRDILILVRSRGTIFHAVNAALQRAGVPVSGADRVQLTKSLAVRDLLSLLRFLATEADDLALAEYLRSPLGGLSEAQLYRLAQPRDGSLWAALRAAPDHADVAARLTSLRNQADFLRPYELLQRALASQSGRAQLTARLGAEAEDAIDALLDLALQYDTVEAPTLTGFLAWVEATDAEVKRQLDSRSNQIRVMTIHGAKGLEAPIVLMPQTHSPREGNTTPRVTAAGDAIFPHVSVAERPEALAPVEEARKARALEESWRLLYVGLTRARSWLIVCGGGDRGKDADTVWYQAVEGAMQTLGQEEDDGILALQSPEWVLEPMGAAPDPQPAPVRLPPWARERGPKVPDAEEILTPSSGGDGAHALPGPDGDDPDAAKARGTALHTLLERLVQAEPLAEADALALLAASPLAPDTLPALVAEANATRLAPDLQWLWQAEALTEVAVSGRVASLGGQVLNGRIDRLLLPQASGGDVWAIDFKSNRTVPATAAHIPQGLVRQMALYQAALAEIFPGHRIRTALLWTATQSLMEIPHNIVTDWLQRHQGVDQPAPAT
ncbi:double-strand break repair helicase AddA [Algicella marina]|uniref:DNA 3'-5' helicase n=1 Tax=Algicella marina TaxID=2683284 RepID=A0A6P1T601_9RHOB|nr:double-strand break repair helicase AddA [Algicella marina]QHQ35992.1 double-strand break repair helicase AddA [Algicella marina]